MARTLGALNQSTIEFRDKLEQYLATGKYPDPVEVLLRLLKSRKPSIRLQAAKCLVENQYPRNLSARLDVDDEGGQLTLAWGDAAEQQPEPIDITDYSEVITDGNA